MKLNLKRSAASAGKRLVALVPAAMLVDLLLWDPGAQAQGVLAPGPEISITPPAVRQYQSDTLDVFPPETTPPNDHEPLMKLGPVELRPHVYYRFAYGDGIPAALSNYVSTTIQEVFPGILMGLGSHWSLDYTPTWRFYSNRQLKDTLDHRARLTGGGAYENWIFGLSQDYSLTSQPEIETGAPTTLETFATALTASYRFNSKSWADLALNQTFVSAENFSSYRQWLTEDWLNYQFWVRLNGAIGASLGYVNSDSSSDMLFERLQARLDWRATDKISLHPRAGFEVRQFLSGDQGNLINPLAGLTLQYQPFEVTRLTLNFDRVVSASYAQSPATESTEIIAGLNQRLLGLLYLDLGGGFHSINYVGSTASNLGAASRTDDFYVFNARLTCPFLKRGTAVLFYQYSDNTSTEAGFTFASHQFGGELSYRY